MIAAARGARVAVTMLVLVMGGATHAEAAGPWKAQIVDAETGQPIEGVVVVAIWKTEPAGIRMHPNREFFDVDEVVSGVDGRIVIPERTLFSWQRFTWVIGPQILMFKAGYGIWDSLKSRSSANGATQALSSKHSIRNSQSFSVMVW